MNSDRRTAFADLDHFLVDIRDAVAVLTINRPDKMNSMAANFWPQLRAVMTALEADSRVRAVVLTGAGDRAFSAGGDLTEFGEPATIGERRAYMESAMAGFAALENSALPVVAAVNGLALGGGCELTFACDLVIASEQARFGMPEAGVGLVPGFGVLRAPSVIGRQWTKYLVFANQRIGADEALRLGMVQQVVPAADLLSRALEIAARIAGQAPLALAVGKKIIGRDIDGSGAGHAADALAMLFSTADFTEGIAAFTEKRPPKFTGK